MEIKRIGENQIRCALTEAEIQEMGFDIEEIIGNSEMTQKFMRVVLNIVEEQENISLDNISPMVKAELLQDHSMAITFGGDSEMSFKSLIDTVNHLMSQMNPEKVQEFKKMSRAERQAIVDEFLEGFHKADKEKDEDKVFGGEHTREAMTCALRFEKLDDVIRMSKVCFGGKLPESSLYKMEGEYYLLLDFTDFSKDEMRPFAFGTVEYDDGHLSDDAQLAHIREQGDCIAKNDALQMLMQL